MNKRQVELWIKGRLFEVMNGRGEQEAKSILIELLSFIGADLEEIKPKFKIGDKITDGEIIGEVTRVEETNYGYKTEDNRYHYLSRSKESEWSLLKDSNNVDIQIKSQNDSLKQLNSALNVMEHNGHLPEVEDHEEVIDVQVSRQNDQLDKNIQETALRLCPLPPFYNEEQRNSEAYANSWARARDEQAGFRLGANWMKRQLMESAVNGKVLGEIRNQESEPYQIYVESDCLPLDGNIKYGDKVKLIIIKEN